MPKPERSKYQKGLIANYYNNLDSIMLNKLSELVTEIYLAKTPEKRDRLWNRAEKAMQNLKIPPAIIGHIIETHDVRLLAKNLNEWLAKNPK